MYMLRWFLLVAFTLLARASPSVKPHDSTFVPDHILSITYQNVSLNCEQRLSTVANGSVPGPVIRIPEGKRSWIRVYNDMPEQNLTMHWHGLSASVAPFSDGSPQASQWPIPAGHYFDYELRPNVGEAGTYFYHSHVEFQAVTAFGALIVEEDECPYQYDEEKVIVLSDYFNTTDDYIIQGLMMNPFRWSGEVQNVLVNGKARPIGSVNSDPACSLESIDVEPGKTYRLRFVGATGLSLSKIGFEKHSSLSLIEADGAYTKPYNTSFVQIGSGQRYSVLLKTKSAKELAKDNSLSKGSYFMELQTLERPTVTTSYAVLRYKQNSPIPHPPTTPSLVLNETALGWLDYVLEPLRPESFPSAKEVTRTVTLHIHQVNHSSSTPQILWTVDDNIPWTESFPQKPYLVALYENQTAALPSYDKALKNGGFDPDVRAFPAKLGEVLDINLQVLGQQPAGEGDVHPFHFHGSHFWDLGSGNGTYDKAAQKKNEAKWKGKQPVKRDTTMVYRPYPTAPDGVGAGWRAWRVKVTEPGVWMLHCHTLQHMVMGMQSVWVFGDSEDVKKLPTPMVDGYLQYGGGAYGNVTYDPNVTHFYDDED